MQNTPTYKTQKLLMKKDGKIVRFAYIIAKTDQGVCCEGVCLLVLLEITFIKSHQQDFQSRLVKAKEVSTTKTIKKPSKGMLGKDGPPHRRAHQLPVE